MFMRSIKTRVLKISCLYSISRYGQATLPHRCSRKGFLQILSPCGSFPSAIMADHSSLKTSDVIPAVLYAFSKMRLAQGLKHHFNVFLLVIRGVNC